MNPRHVPVKLYPKFFHPINQAAYFIYPILLTSSFNPVSQGLSQWWGDMAMCLYPAFIGAGDACEQLGLCKVKSVLGDWTCDDCTDIMTRVANFMQEPSTIEQGVAVLTVRFS